MLEDEILRPSGSHQDVPDHTLPYERDIQGLGYGLQVTCTLHLRSRCPVVKVSAPLTKKVAMA